MTEMNQGMIQSGDTSVSPATPSSVVASTPSTNEERTFRQSDVNDIVKREKHAAIESFKRQMQEQPQYLQTKHPDLNTNPVVQNTAFQEQDVRRIAAEESRKLSEESAKAAYEASQKEYATKIATDFNTKMEAGKTKYQDFDQITRAVNLPNYGNAVHLSTMFENTADIFYSLANDPIKLHTINQMAVTSPDLAYLQMQKLSKSLKDNEAAANVKLPNEPLSQMRPTNTGTDNGVLSVADFRKKYRG